MTARACHAAYPGLMTLDEALAELAALEDPQFRAANEKRGDDHGMNLSHLRALAKRIKTDHALATALWATGETPARLLALLICKPRDFTADELDAMLRQTDRPKVNDWFVNYIAKKSPLAEEMRRRWFGDADPTVAAAAAQFLSPLVLGLEALTVNGKQAHWHVRGANFVGVHELLDTIVAHAGDFADTAAERIVALGLPIDARLSAVAEKAGATAVPAGFA